MITIKIKWSDGLIESIAFQNKLEFANFMLINYINCVILDIKG